MNNAMMVLLTFVALFGDSITLQQGVDGYEGCTDVTILDPQKHYVFDFSGSTVSSGDAVELMIGEFEC